MRDEMLFAFLHGTAEGLSPVTATCLTARRPVILLATSMPGYERTPFAVKRSIPALFPTQTPGSAPTDSLASNPTRRPSVSPQGCRPETGCVVRWHPRGPKRLIPKTRCVLDLLIVGFGPICCSLSPINDQGNLTVISWYSIPASHKPATNHMAKLSKPNHRRYPTPGHAIQH